MEKKENKKQFLTQLRVSNHVDMGIPQEIYEQLW